MLILMTRINLVVLTLWMVVDASESIDYCEEYDVCLEKLEAKQRECLKLPAFEKDDFTSKEEDEECIRQERRRMQRELNGLQLRRTEVLGDCIAAHISRGESVLDLELERRCKSAVEKLQIFSEIVLKTKEKPAKKKKKTVPPKHSHKVCRRVKKMLSKKCNDLSKCCSIAADCEIVAESVTEQISRVRRELHDPQVPQQKCLSEDD